MEAGKAQHEEAMGKVSWVTYAQELELCMKESGWHENEAAASCRISYGKIKLVPFVRANTGNDFRSFPEVVLDMSGAMED